MLQNKYLSDFSSLLRESLQYNDRVYIPLTLKTNARYLVRWSSYGFNLHIALAVQMKTPTNTEIPSLLIQPLVENAVKHGISRLHEKGKIEIVLC